MEEKHSSSMEYLAEGTNLTELCEAFGISRTLGYRYIRGCWEEGKRMAARALTSAPPCLEKELAAGRRSDPTNASQVSPLGRAEYP